MVVDPHLHDLPFSIDGFDFEYHNPLLDPDQSLHTANGSKSIEPAVGADSSVVPPLSIRRNDLNDMPVISIDDPDRELVFPAGPNGGSLYPSMSLGMSLNAGGVSPSPLDGNVLSNPILEYVSQMLMEENVEEKFWIKPDNPALREIERSLYDALGEQMFQAFDASQFTWNLNSSSSGSRIDPNSLHHIGEHNHTIASTVCPLDRAPQLNLHCSYCTSSMGNFIGELEGFVKSTVQVKTTSDDNYTAMQFTRGLQEASKFLPTNSQLVIVNCENVSTNSRYKRRIREVDAYGNKGSSEDGLSGSRGRKNHEREDLGLVEARAIKQKTSYTEEAELWEMFDGLLLCTEKVEPPCPTGSSLLSNARKNLQTGAPICGFDGGRGRRSLENDSSVEVDLRALLILCAQALSSNDLRTANELLKKIQENSSPSGNGSQRLAHYFANGLEARMVGNQGEMQSLYGLVASKRRSVVDLLKAHQLHFSSHPLMRLSMFHMNYMIWKLSQKATVLHIIDFGIGFGFKWPVLIQNLGELASGPPKLRITGIELPQPGFPPTQIIEETGQRLAQCCERFNVPFEFHALSSRNWEAIKIEDLKIKSGEVIVATCLARFGSLGDGTTGNVTKDVTLSLIRQIKPDVFVHAVTNGSYNVPFFLTRFKAALFHMSSIYDMFDATIPGEHRDSEERTMLENNVFGEEIMNVVACEGPGRAERPEKYKQWQVRHERAGFKQLPLDKTMITEFRHKLRAWYHKDFTLDADGMEGSNNDCYY